MRTVVERVRGATSVPVVLGGAGFTVYSTELMGALGADYGIVGEGERASALFDALEAGRSAADLPGVALPGRPAPPAVPLGKGGDAATRAVTDNPALGFYLAHGGIVGIQTPTRLRPCAASTAPTRASREARAGPSHPEAVALEAKRSRMPGRATCSSRIPSSTPTPLTAWPSREPSAASPGHLPWGAFFAPVSPVGRILRAHGSGRLHPRGVRDGVAYRRHVAALRQALSSIDDVVAAHREREGGRAPRRTLHDSREAPARRSGRSTRPSIDATPWPVPRSSSSAGCGYAPGTGLEGSRAPPGSWSMARACSTPVFYEPPDLPLAAIADRVSRRATGRSSWIVGAGADRAAGLLARLYERGHKGPLWERLADA